MDIKTSLYVTKIFENDLVAIRKSKIVLKGYRGMYITYDKMLTLIWVETTFISLPPPMLVFL